MYTLLAAAALTLAAQAPAVSAPVDEPERVLTVENAHDYLAELTEVVAHGGGFATLHRGTDRWRLLTSADGFAWTTTPVSGRFAAIDAPLSLAAHGGELLAFELAPDLVMWRSPDGRRWQRTALDSPWPASAGLRVDVNHVEARRVGDHVHVFASSTVHAQWETLFGVPDRLVAPDRSSAESLRIRVVAGDRAGDYQVRLEAEQRSVLLRVVDAEDQVVGEQRLAPIADPANFIELFIACGGFSPMTESWWVGPDGELVARPGWSDELGDYPTIAAGRDATFAFDQQRGLLRLDGTRAWQPATAPTSLIQYLFVAGGRAVLVGEEPAEGMTLWAFDAGEWRRLPAPAIDGMWLAAAVPDGRGAVLVYDSEDRRVIATVVGRDGRARTYRLDLPEAVWGMTVQGGSAVVRTVGGDGDSALWAWRIERPEPALHSPF